MTAEQNPFRFFPIYHHHLAASVPSSAYTTSHQCVSSFISLCAHGASSTEHARKPIGQPSLQLQVVLRCRFRNSVLLPLPPNPMASTLYIIIILCPQLPLLFFLRCERQKNNTKKSEKEEKVVLRCVGSRLLI